MGKKEVCIISWSFSEHHQYSYYTYITKRNIFCVNKDVLYPFINCCLNAAKKQRYEMLQHYRQPLIDTRRCGTSDFFHDNLPGASKNEFS